MSTMVQNNCWLWAGVIRSDGYGGIWNSIKNQYDVAHRLVYEALVGTIPDNLQLDHLCRNRSCVNPDHLEPVTLKVNVLRGEGAAAKNARKTHCQNGHEFDKIDTTGARQCRACRLEYTRKYYKRNAERLRAYSKNWQNNKRQLILQGDK